MAELGRRGHLAHAPTHPGLAPDATDRAGVALSSLIAHACHELTARDMADVVVVSHSGGGPVAQGIAEAHGDRVRRLAFMSAVVLLDGESILGLRDPARQADYRQKAAATRDNTVPMDDDLWVRELCSDMSEADARAWLPKVVPCPLGWLTEPAYFPTAAWREIPSSYIFLDGERPAAQARYEQMAARLSGPRIGRCPGAHEAMLSQPLAVAEAILRVTRA